MNEIQHLREHLGLSQKAFAETIETYQETCSNYEMGYRPISPRVLIRLWSRYSRECGRLHITLERLLKLNRDG